jgi:hypothetical protein
VGWLRVLLLFLWSVPAFASARIVVTASEPVQLFLDGMVVPTSIGNVRSAIPHVQPGVHTLAVHDLRGSPLHSEKISVPEGADVRVQWTRGAVFVISGASPPGATNAAGSELPAPGEARTDFSADTPSGVASRDLSQPYSSGNLGRASGPRASDVLQGNGVSTGRATMLQRAVTTGNPTAIATGAAVSGVRSLTYGAQAGTSFGAGTEFRQKIVQANVVYGHVDLTKSGGGPIHIYDGGMLVAQLGEGATKVAAKFEVGRREIEIRSGLDNRVLFQGDLNVDRDHNIQLAVSDTEAPRTTVRPWLWQGY